MFFVAQNDPSNYFPSYMWSRYNKRGVSVPWSMHRCEARVAKICCSLGSGLTSQRKWRSRGKRRKKTHEHQNLVFVVNEQKFSVFVHKSVRRSMQQYYGTIQLLRCDLDQNFNLGLYFFLVSSRFGLNTRNVMLKTFKLFWTISWDILSPLVITHIPIFIYMKIFHFSAVIFIPANLKTS